MVRYDRNFPDVYFGRPGALVKMPYPRGDMDRSYDRQVSDFMTATGQHIVSTMLGGSRTYSVVWNALHMDNYKPIEQYWLGAMGQGPWVFVDPSMPNMLLPNQAAATNVFFDARHLSINSLGQLISNGVPTQIHRPGATRALRWYFVTAPGATFPVLSFTPPYRSWYGFPVVPTLPYTFSFNIKPDLVVDTSITVAAKMGFYDASGALIGTESTSGDIVVTDWTRLFVTATPPSNAAYVKPTVVVTGSTVIVGSSIHLDEFMLEQDSVVNNWAPGTGLRPVEMTAFNDTVPFNARFRKGLTMTLKELAP